MYILGWSTELGFNWYILHAGCVISKCCRLSWLKRFSPLLREANQSRLILFSHTDGRVEKAKTCKWISSHFCLCEVFCRNVKPDRHETTYVASTRQNVFVLYTADHFALQQEKCVYSRWINEFISFGIFLQGYFENVCIGSLASYRVFLGTIYNKAFIL